MNLGDIKKILTIASSGEMQGLIEKFARSMDEINADREKLKQAFPAGWKHFEERCDGLAQRIGDLDTKLDKIVGMLTCLEPVAASIHQQQQEQTNHVGNHIINVNGDARNSTGDTPTT